MRHAVRLGRAAALVATCAACGGAEARPIVTPSSLHCSGSGRPAVVLDSGAGNGLGQWRRIQPVVAATTEACSWTRPGVAGQPAPPGAMPAGAIVGRLHAELAAAGVGPPYIPAGHSLGGFFSLLFAHRYATQVRGLVLVDATPPSVISRFGFGVTSDGRHDVDLRAASRTLNHTAPPGTIVVVHGRANFGRAGEREWRRAQAALARAPHSLLVYARRSGHDIPKEQPQLVVGALLDAVHAARAAGAPTCNAAIARAGGSCSRGSG